MLVYLLSMADQLSLGNDARRSNISLQNDTVSAARRQHLTIPRQCTDTGRVALQFVDLLVSCYVPNLNISVICSNSHQISLKKNSSIFTISKKKYAYPLIPSNGSDWIRVAGEITESCDLAGESWPQVDATAEANAQHVLWRPVNKVEVEVVLQFWRVQHFERDSRYFPGGLPGRAQQFLAFGADGV